MSRLSHRQGAGVTDYLELDVQRTRDGVLIALHDDTLSRTSNVAQVFPGRENNTVDSFTFAELQQLDVGGWFNQRFPGRARHTFRGLHVLRLEDIVEIAEGAARHIGLCIETKSPDRFPGIEQQVVEELAKRGWSGRAGPSGGAPLVFQSFAPESLVQFKLLAPQVPRILLVDETLMDRLGWDGILKNVYRVCHGDRHLGTPVVVGPRLVTKGSISLCDDLALVYRRCAPRWFFGPSMDNR